jgi:hypothetical protein
VPVVVVFTKFDRLVIEKAEELEEAEDDASDDILLHARQSANKDIDDLREAFKVGNQAPPLVTVSGTCYS